MQGNENDDSVDFSGRDDQAYLVSLAGLIIVLTWIIPYVNQLFQDINTLFGF